jgi:hypothetical protein
MSFCVRSQDRSKGISDEDKYVEFCREGIAHWCRKRNIMNQCSNAQFLAMRGILAQQIHTEILDIVGRARVASSCVTKYAPAFCFGEVDKP